jgi:septal ring factor EnvC (AmiA/AmiB activator)
MKLISLTLLALLSFTPIAYSAPNDSQITEVRNEEISKNNKQIERNNQKIQFDMKKIEFLNKSLAALKLKSMRLSYDYAKALGTFKAISIGNEIDVTKNDIKEKQLELSSLNDEIKILQEENLMLTEANKSLQ